MEGSGSSDSNVEDARLGIMPLAFKHIFETISRSPTKQFLVRASYMEIYNEEIHDLLSKNPKTKLEMRETPEGTVFIAVS